LAFPQKTIIMDKRGKKVIKGAVKERISRLLSEAHSAYPEHPERSERYLRLLWKLVQRYKVRLSKGQKLSFCKKCFTPWIPSRSAGVSFEPRNSVVQYECKKCGFRRRLKYK
jgi:ribonuclease P protein subunit RPR2